MAGRTSASLAMLMLFLAGASRLYAQNMGEYSFQLLPDGTPRFTQVLRWEGDPNVLYYEVSLQSAAGEDIAVWKIEHPVLELNLGPGEYRYRIVLYNLLGKPELELPWRSLTVRKAEIPRIASLSRDAWFLDDLEPEVTLSGENLSPGATIALHAVTASEPPVIGKELERNGTSTVSVVFPTDSLSAGAYTLVITNPGGLSVTIPNALVVRYRPVDMLLSVGFAPWVPLYDAWYTEAWPGSFFPLSAMSRLSAYFIKQPYGHFGAELAIGGRLMKGGIETAVIDSQIGLIGLNGIYKYLFSKAFSIAGRIGGGLTLSHHAFEYDGSTGSEICSIDPYLSAGGSIQFFPTKHIFLEAGIEWMHVFTRDFSEGGLVPSLSAGVLF